MHAETCSVPSRLLSGHSSVAGMSVPVRLIDGPTRHPGCTGSQQKRKRVQEIVGWVKTVGVGLIGLIQPGVFRSLLGLFVPIQNVSEQCASPGWSTKQRLPCAKHESWRILLGKCSPGTLTV